MTAIRIAKIVSFVALSFFFSCGNSVEEVKKATNKNLNPGVEVADSIKINYTTGGKIKAQLQAPLMYRVEDTVSYVEFPKHIHVDFFNAEGVKESMLDAKYGKYNELQSKVFLKDSVRFIGMLKGDTMYTDELYWDRNRMTYQFYTEKPVTILTKTQIIHGVGFEVSQDFRDKWIKNTTNTYFRVPTSSFPAN